jgi:EAL and modified HD-GYP domain-containing signal transduction protein
MSLLVARQPIFDREERLFGYDLVMSRPSINAVTATRSAGEQLVADFLGTEITTLAGDTPAFVPIDRQMLEDRAVELVSPDRIIPQDPSAMAVIDALRQCGYRVAIAPRDPLAVPKAILDGVDVVKVDVTAFGVGHWHELDAWRHGRTARLLATNVRDRAERVRWESYGFDLFHGFQSSGIDRPLPRDLPVEHLVTARALRLVCNPDTSDHEIEALMRRDASLAYKLLRLVNSAAVGARDIWSIGHALRLLGRDQVGRWLAMLLVTGSGTGGVRGELMELALVRARLCELLAIEAGVPKAGGSLFLVGLLSPLDQLLEVPMLTVVDQLDLAPDLRNALLTRSDFHGDVLAMVEAYEMGWWAEVAERAAVAGFSADRVGARYVEAVAWAAMNSPREHTTEPGRDTPRGVRRQLEEGTPRAKLAIVH